MSRQGSSHPTRWSFFSGSSQIGGRLDSRPLHELMARSAKMLLLWKILRLLPSAVLYMRLHVWSFALACAITALLLGLIAWPFTL